MATYIRVVDDETMPEDAIELPSDDDGTIPLSTIQAQFPGSTGLRYRNEETMSLRGVRLADGVLYPPPEGWGNALYIVVSSKNDSSTKRKYEESPTGREPNPKIMRNYALDGNSDDEYLGDMIVLGLSWKAKDEDVKEYFSRFGELDYYEVKKNAATGQSRGFAFVRFKDIEVTKAVLARQHTIIDRRVDIRMSKGKDDTPKKIFIGRLPQACTAAEVREYFENFGLLSDVYLPQPFRQFGFVTFASGNVAREVLGRTHVIKGARVNVTPAEPKAGSGGKNFHESSPVRGGSSKNYGMNNYGEQAVVAAAAAPSFANPMSAMWNLAAINSVAQGLAGGMGGLSGLAGMNGLTGAGLAATGMNPAVLGNGMNMATAAMAQGGGLGAHGGMTGMTGGATSMDSSTGGVTNDGSYAMWNRDTTRS